MKLTKPGYKEHRTKVVLTEARETVIEVRLKGVPFLFYGSILGRRNQMLRKKGQQYEIWNMREVKEKFPGEKKRKP